MKNLIIVCAGNDSLHLKWSKNTNCFDLVVLYYGDCDLTFNNFKSKSTNCFKVKGHKWHLISNYITNNLNKMFEYEYIWFPDDDLLTNSIDISTLFNVCKKYNLLMGSPALSGYVSHEIHKPQKNTLLRFTDFVEVICPVMHIDSVLKLHFSFTLNESAWGLDFLWPKLLGYPKDKIAIVDTVVVEHTRPIGSNYSNRFKIEPLTEMHNLFKEYNLTWKQNVYSSILLNEN